MYICVYVCRSNVPCCLYWQSPEILLVGRGHLVKVRMLLHGCSARLQTRCFVREKGEGDDDMLRCVGCGECVLQVIKISEIAKCDQN